MALGMTVQSRSVLKRAVEYVKTAPGEIAADYVSFERLYGSLQQLEQAEQKYSVKVPLTSPLVLEDTPLKKVKTDQRV